MKKITIILLSIALVLGGCNNQGDKVVLSKEEYNELKGEVVKPEYPKRITLFGVYKTYEFYVVKGSDNHEYLTWSGSHAEIGLTHYPSCKYCTKTSL